MAFLCFFSTPSRRCEPGPRQPDFLIETSPQLQHLPWPTRRHYIGALFQTGPPKMAVYSLTGNDSSPFHAEPAQLRHAMLPTLVPPTARRQMYRDNTNPQQENTFPD